MNREEALVKNTLIISLGTFLPQLFNFITIPVLTNYLSVDEYGTYDLIITVVALLLPIATLQIQSAAFRFLLDIRGEKEKCKVIVSNILIFITIISLCVLIVFSLVLNLHTVNLEILICVYLLLDVLYNTLGQIIRGLSDNKGYAVGAIVLSALKTILIVLFVICSKKGIEGILIAFCVAYLTADIFLIIRGRIYIYVSLNVVSLAVIKKLLCYSWPMVPNNLSAWVLKMSDRFVITYYLGTSANAIYAAANNIPNIVNLVRSVFVMAWQENASLAVEDEDSADYYSKMFERTFSLVFGVTTMLIGLTPVLFRILIKGNYQDAYGQMPILFLGTFFGCISAFQGGIYIAHKKTVNGGLSMIVAAMINLWIDLLLIEYIGIYAGSVSTLVSYFVLFTFRLFDILRFQKMKYNWRTLGEQVFVILLMCVFCLLEYDWLNVLNAIMGCIFAIYFNTELVADIVKKIMKKIKGKC